MSFNLLREIRAEFTRLGWGEHSKQVFLVSVFRVGNEGLLLLDERQHLLSVKKLKPIAR